MARVSFRVVFCGSDTQYEQPMYGTIIIFNYSIMVILDYQSLSNNITIWAVFGTVLKQLGSIN